MSDFRSNLPLGTQDPVVLKANAGNMDEAVNNPVPATWLDRFGNERKNMAAVEQSAPLASAAADRSEAAADRAENAATAATLNIETYYPTIEAGRAAVANGQSFWVEPNSTDALTRFSLFTRTSATTQDFKFQAIDAREFDAGVARVEGLLPRMVDNPNLFTARQLRGEDPPDVRVGNTDPGVYDERQCVRLSAPAGTVPRAIWRFPRESFFEHASASIVIAAVNAGAAGSLNRFAILYRTAALAVIRQDQVAAPNGTTDAVTLQIAGSVIPANAAFVDFDIQFSASSTESRTAYLRSLHIGTGTNTSFVAPISDVTRGDIEAVNARIDDVAGALPDLSRIVDNPNVFSAAQIRFDEGPFAVVEGAATQATLSDRLVLDCEGSATTAGHFRAVWRFPRSSFLTHASASIVIESANEGRNVPARNMLRMTFLNAANGSISFVDAAIPWQAVTSPLFVSIESAEIPENTERVQFDVYMASAADTPKRATLRSPHISSGSSAAFLPPIPDITRSEFNAVKDEVSQTGSDVAALAGSVAVVEQQISSISVSGDMLGNLAALPTWVRAFPITVSQQSISQASISYDSTDPALIDTGRLEIYVNPITGNDANAGTEAAPFRTMTAALAATSNARSNVINLPEGAIFYNDASMLGATWFNKPQHLSIRGNGAILTSAYAPGSLVWTSQGDGVYSAPIASGAQRVFDRALLDYRGMPIECIRVGSEALVRSTPASHWVNGSSVWVHTFDGRSPDDGVLVNQPHVGNTFTQRGGKNVRIENLNAYLGASSGSVAFINGQQGAHDAYAQVINCRFAGAAEMGLALNRLRFSAVDTVTSAYVERDGLNYHALWSDPANRRSARALEINSHAYSCGMTAGIGNSNATSAHDGMHIVRLNPVGFDTNGPTLADVNGCRSLVISGQMGRSTLAASNAQAASYYSDNSESPPDGPGEMLLIGCAGSGSTYDINSDGAAIKLRGWRGGNPRVGSGATVESF